MSKYSESAYPYVLGEGLPGISKLELFMLHAPEPSDDWINMHQQMDRNLNPHNDSYKPRRRSREELIASYKREYAVAMLDAAAASSVSSTMRR